MQHKESVLKYRICEDLIFIFFLKSWKMCELIQRVRLFGVGAHAQVYIENSNFNHDSFSIVEIMPTLF